jgi:hypothetical protein
MVNIDCNSFSKTKPVKGRDVTKKDIVELLPPHNP